MLSNFALFENYFTVAKNKSPYVSIAQSFLSRHGLKSKKKIDILFWLLVKTTFLKWLKHLSIPISGSNLIFCLQIIKLNFKFGAIFIFIIEKVFWMDLRDVFFWTKIKVFCW